MTEPPPVLPPRPLRRWLVVVLLTLGIPLAVTLIALRIHAWPPEVEALFIREAAVAVAGPDGTDWQAVSLPYRCPTTWNPDAEPDGCTRTFRVGLRHEPAGDGLWSLYIPGFQGSVEVSLNGTFLESSVWQQSASEVSAVIPMLVVLPSALLRPGGNEVEITLTKKGIISGFLDKIAIGPDARLRPDHDRRVFLFSTLPRMIDGWQIAMGLAMFIMWLSRPGEQIFLVFSILLLSHATQSLPGIVGDALDERILRLSSQARFLSGSLVLPLAYLFVGRRPPAPVWVFLLPPAAVALSHFALPMQAHAWVVGKIASPVVLAIMVWATVVVAREAVVNRNSAAALLTGTFLVTVALAFHDWLILRGALGERSVMLGRFGAPIFMAAIGGVLIWRFGQAMSRLDRLSARLQDEVAAAEDALRHSFTREKAQERKAVLEQERVRLMSDLHDGIAGQLVSILALCELRGTGSDEVAEAVRSALADLRLVVASLEEAGDDLGVMLALFRERIEPQLAAHGLALEWRTAELPEVAGLHPGATLAIFRILQEATINAARHSGSPILKVEAGPSPLPDHGARLSVSDRGRGGVAERQGGRGLGNLRRRAEALGAELTIASGPDGTTVTLDLLRHLP
ncbi:sensor histidine kinase [Azospirillum sp. sgz301742]